MPRNISMLRRMSKVEKCVGWAYPSSPDARRFGFPKGCWVISFTYVHPTESVPPKSMRGFGTYEEAQTNASHWPEPWSRYTAPAPSKP